MHQVSLEIICSLKALQLHCCPDMDAKIMMKRSYNGGNIQRNLRVMCMYTRIYTK